MYMYMCMRKIYIYIYIHMHLMPNPIHICIYIYRTLICRTSIDKIKENDFKLTKERSRRCPAKTITDADYADDIALLVNAPAHAESQLHSLEWAAAGIGVHVNAHKMEYMCFNERLNISSLKLVDKFTSVGSSVSSTETDIDTRQAKVCSR